MSDHELRSASGADRARPFDPPAIDRRHVALANDLSVRRRPVAIGIGDAAFSFVTVGLQPSRSEAGAAETVALWFSLDGCSAVLQLPFGLYERMLSRIEPELLVADVDKEILPLLLESCIADALATAEAKYQGRIELVAIERSAAIDFFGVQIAIEIAIDGAIAGKGTLHIAETEAERIAALFVNGPKIPSNPTNLSVELSVRNSVVWLSLGELRSLSVGDVLLTDDRTAHRDYIAVTLGEIWLFHAQFTPDGLKQIEPLRRAAAKDRELWMMVDSMQDTDGEDELSEAFDQARKVEATGASTDAEASATDDDGDVATGEQPEESTFDELPIKLVFELGRLEMTLGRLQEVGPGHIFELGRSVGEAVQVYAGGRRIGQGDIVKIDDQIGVRMARLFGDV